MDRVHDPRHEEVLAAVLAGDLAADAGPAGDLVRCPICAERLQRLGQLQGLLDDAGIESRAVMDALREPDAPPAPHRWRRLPLLAGAAALLGICLAVLPMRSCDRQPDGNQNLELKPDSNGFKPSGEVPAGAGWGPFQWRADKSALEARYVVRVHRVEPDGSVSADPVVESPRLVELQWQPDDADRVRLQQCDRIVWMVLVEDMATRATTRMREVSAHRR